MTWMIPRSVRAGKTDGPAGRRTDAPARQRTGVAVAVAALVSAGALAAHDTWLLPSVFITPAGQVVTLGLTSATAFPEPETLIGAERVRTAELRLAGRTRALRAFTAGSRELVVRTRPDRAGYATIFVTLHPRTLELTEDQVAHYLDEIGAGASLREAWERAPAPRRWRETYVKHAKTFVRVGPARDSSWAEPVGQELEIVPESDPAALHAGDTLAVRVLRGGAPLAGVAVGVVIEGQAPQRFTTDEAGRARFALTAPGRALLRVTDIRAAAAGDGSWQSDFATLTLLVTSPRC